MNVDAKAAVAAARSGRCRDAMKHLFDAAPHKQVDCSDGSKYDAAAKDFQHAGLIVAGACTINAKRGQYKTQGFTGSRRRRRRSRR